MYLRVDFRFLFWTSDKSILLMWSLLNLLIISYPILQRNRSDWYDLLWTFEPSYFFVGRFIGNSDISVDPYAFVCFGSVIETDELSHIFMNVKWFIVSNWNGVGTFEYFAFSCLLLWIYCVSAVVRVYWTANTTS